jgi:glucokinase
MTEHVGVDVGGTFIKAGRVDGAGRILDRVVVPTDVEGGVDAIESRIREVVSKLGHAGSCGVGVPGAVDHDRGVVRSSPNIPCWKDYPARERLAAALGCSVALDNDANCAALAEGWVGAARDVESFLLITLGTGVGGGVVLAGRLWRGESGRAGELGHVVVDPDGRPCGCGSRGCLETVASATGIARQAASAGLEGSVEDLARAARAGGSGEREIFDEAGRALGIAISDWLNILDVHTILIAGGVAGALDLLGPALEREVERRVYAFDSSHLALIPALLGEDAGIVGAARLCTDGDEEC